MRWFVLLLGLAAACRGPVTPVAPTADPVAAMSDLRFRIGTSGEDLPAHLALARLAADHRLPGIALRHFQVVARNRSLASGDRSKLATLLAARASERIEDHDGGALADIELARSHDPKIRIERDLILRAHRLAALAALRRRDRKAVDLELSAVRILAPADTLLVLAAPRRAALSALGQTAVWAWDGGARREGLALLELYVERKGREPQVLARFARARYWWKGAAGLDYLDRSMLIGAQVELCSIASAPDERGCGATLAAVKGHMAQERLLRRARRLHWPAAVTAQLGKPGADSPLGSKDNEDDGLDQVGRAFRKDPALADRLARDYADGAHSVGRRGPALARLFAELGDPARALAWWQDVAASSPGHPAYTRELTLAAVAAAEPTRALVHGYRAALQSGDGGALHLDLAAALLVAGSAVEALYAARNAINLSARTEQVSALVVVVQATHQLGRPQEHSRARTAYLDRIDPRYRARAAAWLDGLIAASAGGSGH